MRFKKILIGVSSILALGSLVGCGGPAEEKSWDLVEPGTLKAGFTSLANQNANAPLNADGTYVAGGKTFRVKDVFRTTYATEPIEDLYNYLCNSWTYSSEHYTNMVDGLVENDKYGNIVGAVALGYKVEDLESGEQKWTFQLRENAEWVDNKTGKFSAYVKAQDFVDGIKYVLDPANGSSTTAMVTGFLKGAFEYYQGKAKGEEVDFDSVGVKALDEHTVEYTLPEPMPYFITALTYSPYLPVRGEYLKKVGSKFGETPDKIEANGAFRITKHQYEAKFEYKKNIHYYDRDHVYVNKVIKTYVPGTATLSTTREWFEAGEIDSFSVRAKDEEGWNKYVKGPDGTGSLKNPYAENCNSIQSYGDTTYIGYWNFNRTTFAYNEAGNAKSDAQKKATAAALLNKKFRQGFLRGLNVMEYLKLYDPEEPYNYLMRGYTNHDLVSAGGKDYTDYVNEVFNEKQGTSGKSLIGIDNGGDVVLDAAKAAELFAAAKQELIAAGWCAEADFPIRVDVIGDRSNDVQVYEKAMYAAFDAEALKPFVKIVYNVPASDEEEKQWGISGSQSGNYDFSMQSGWGPDYADPNTFLHTMCVDGDMIQYSGLYVKYPLSTFLPAALDIKSYDDLQHYILDDYDALYRAGAAVTDPTKMVERFEKFALAEYDLIFESAIIVPWLSGNGYSASVSKTVPWQAGRASYGLTGDKLKNVVVTENAMTKADRKAVTDEYNAGK